MMTKTLVSSYESRLYFLLQDRLAAHVKRSRLNVRSLAKAVGVSASYMYMTLSKERISDTLATSLVSASEGKLSYEDLIPFSDPPSVSFLAARAIAIGSNGALSTEDIAQFVTIV